LASFYEKFLTPLQINHYAWSSLTKAHQIGQKPVDIDVLNEVISKDLDGIEATLKRYGYDTKALSEEVDVRLSEITNLFQRSVVIRTSH
jgi:N-acetyl-anhydromuramyl-L-alanine amidase AmpD